MSIGDSRGSLGAGTYASMLKSLPIKVHWAGFESDTLKMQQNGWSVSAWEDVACMQMQLAFSKGGDQGSNGSPNQLRGISSKFDWQYLRNFQSWPTNGMPEVVAHIQAIGSRIHIHHHGDMPKFRAVDCQPQMWEGKITSLDDYAHFIPAGNDRVQDIIVAEPEVEDLLARILEKQQPAKVARATEAMYEERASGLMVPKIHAKIISLSERRVA